MLPSTHGGISGRLEIAAGTASDTRCLDSALHGKHQNPPPPRSCWQGVLTHRTPVSRETGGGDKTTGSERPSRAPLVVSVNVPRETSRFPTCSSLSGSSARHCREFHAKHRRRRVTGQRQGQFHEKNRHRCSGTDGARAVIWRRHLCRSERLPKACLRLSRCSRVSRRTAWPTLGRSSARRAGMSPAGPNIGALSQERGGSRDRRSR